MKSAFTDELYPKELPAYSVKEGEVREPKEQFKLAISLISKYFHEGPGSLLDVGCATGAFLEYAKLRFPKTRLSGLDFSESFCHRASQLIPDAKFYCRSLLDSETELDRPLDVITCLGTLGIFDDLEPPLKNMMRLLNSGGYLIISDLVQDEPVELLVRYRTVSKEEDNDWLTGLNIRCKLAYEKVLYRIDPKVEIVWHDFEMSKAIPKGSDPFRGWTIKTEKQVNQLVTGGCLMQTFKFAVIRKGF